jgi:MFS family permease
MAGLSEATIVPAGAVTPAPRNDDRVIETSIPARLDSLTWSGFHTRVVLALGITWILDGLEVTLAGALSGALKESPKLQFSNFDVGFSNSAYLAGAVIGALGFGWLTDRIGRKKLFFITLALYLTATAATALSWNLASYALFRFLTGAGIGGEYTAINSTIQELVPARYRGWTDLVINGSFWIGAAMGAVAAIVLLDPNLIGPDLGWRLAYLTGAVLGLVVFVMRLWIPESPRWLMIHGKPEEAHAIVADIERSAIGEVQDQPHHAWPKIKLRMRSHTPLREVAVTLFSVYRQRSLVGLAPGRLVHFAVCGRQFPRALVAGPAVRHRGPAGHDHGHLRGIRCVAGAVGLSVLDRRADGADPDHRLDGDFLLCLAGRKQRLSHRQRDVSAGGPGARHCAVLCGRDRNWRRVRAGAVRGADRYRIAQQRIRGLFAGSWTDDRRGLYRVALLHRRRATVTGIRRTAARLCGVG